MAGLEELKKKLVQLFVQRKGFHLGQQSSDSYLLSDGGTVKLLSKSYNIYNINELGLQKCSSSSSPSAFSVDDGEKTHRCASHVMRVFGSIGSGASSVGKRAIHIPNHRIIALKKINVFEMEKRKQLLNEIRTLCEAPCYEGLVQFYGAFYTPDSGRISIALEYNGSGSLCKTVPEPVLSIMVQKLLLILEDPSPSLLDKGFSPEFCSFIDDCLKKDSVARPTAEKPSSTASSPPPIGMPAKLGDAQPA